MHHYFSIRAEHAIYTGIVFRRTRCCTSQPEEHHKRENPFITPRNRWMPTQSKIMPILAEHDWRHQILHISLRYVSNVRDSEPTGNTDESRYSRWILGKDWHISIIQQRQGLSGDCRLLEQLLGSRLPCRHRSPNEHRQSKAHCARHGIPDTIVSDNDPQYSCHAFAIFCESWDITQVTSSSIVQQQSQRES